MSIMSASVVHRRGKPASLSSKKRGGAPDASQNDRNDKKKQKPFNLERILVGVLIALAIIIGIMWVLPEDSGTNKRVVGSPFVAQDASDSSVP